MKMNYYRAPATPGALPNLAEAALATKSLSTCSHYLSITGVADLLRGAEPFTLFAPTDEAFQNLAPETLAILTADVERMRAVLQYHVIAGSRESHTFANGRLKTVEGTLLLTAITDDGLRIDHANTCGRQINCSNGIIHPIDAVLMPGYTPSISAKAREHSAWTGRPQHARQPKADESWPFLEPKEVNRTP